MAPGREPMNQYSVVFCAFFLGCLHPALSGNDSLPPVADRKVVDQALQDASQPVKSVKDIPPYVMIELRKIVGEPTFKIAERDQEFNSSDIKVSDYNRRIIFATRSERYFVLCYESTQSPPSVVVFAIHPEAHAAELLLVGKVEQGECSTLPQVQKAYREQKIAEYRPTYLDF